MSDLCLFDLDDTLLPIDSDHAWGEFIVRIGWVDAAEFARRNDAFYAQYQAGQLDIQNITRAASQFFALLKGELHTRLLCGCAQALSVNDIDEHVAATVDFFLRAYTPRANC